MELHATWGCCAACQASWKWALVFDHGTYGNDHCVVEGD